MNYAIIVPSTLLGLCSSSKSQRRRLLKICWNISFIAVRTLATVMPVSVSPASASPVITVLL